MSALAPEVLVKVCGWCYSLEVKSMPTVTVVWRHDPVDCWCESNAANGRRHVSATCALHEARERADLEELGYEVVAVYREDPMPVVYGPRALWGPLG
ncbi:hypothetical protein [Nocardioides sp.]|uniref:hypothetical protein n=1 Tax=Nocardioides sp. TaxID=35761 RepID=UPI002BC343BE|nr:hypothetical protein [Nocardioides sp.]HSX67218.1 hypothetical protein [Nocardioides sp.]